ncbi:MAG: hypothetical protein ACRBN8_00565 [Nannocystales bacterium]
MPLLRPIALCCVVSLAVPTVALAQPAAPDGVDPDVAAPEDSGALREAEVLYKRGRSSFETANYLEAIDLWEEAYGLIQDVPENAAIKAALIYNIAAAQEKAYDIDTDITHLRQAAVLMETYARSVPALYGDEDEAQVELDKIDKRMAELRQRIEEAESGSEVAPTEPQPEHPDIEPTFKPDPRAKPLIIAGAVTAGVGVVGLGLMAGGLSMGSSANELGDDVSLEDRREQFDRGRLGNTLAYVGGAAGGVFLVTGAVLLGIGLKKRSAGTMAVTPWGGRGTAGMSVGGRF